METLEEYGIEARRLQGECDAKTPEGYICLVDYYPEPPYWLFYLFTIVVAGSSYILILKEEKKEGLQ